MAAAPVPAYGRTMVVHAAWLVIVGEVVARNLARADWRRLPLAPSSDRRPAPGDRIAVLRTHRPAYVASAALIGTADVRRDLGDSLEVRHRVVAPTAHEPSLVGLRLRVATSWTHARLGELLGHAIPLEDKDHERAELALLDEAHAFGPAPSRPAHRRPRTPGRRALLVGRLLARRPKNAR